VEQSIPADVLGIDRNLSNITVSNLKNVVMYDVAKAVQIADNSRSVMRALERNDVRIGKRLAMKHGRRRKARINQLLHKVSKAIVQQAKEQNAAIAFEDIRSIWRLYLRGNYRVKDYHSRMNSWP